MARFLPEMRDRIDAAASRRWGTMTSSSERTRDLAHFGRVAWHSPGAARRPPGRVAPFRRAESEAPGGGEVQPYSPPFVHDTRASWLMVSDPFPAIVEVLERSGRIPSAHVSIETGQLH